VTSDDLVERFTDLIEDDPEKFTREFEEFSSTITY
jgi:hypothetical protein